MGISPPDVGVIVRVIGNPTRRCISDLEATEVFILARYTIPYGRKVLTNK